MIGLRLNTLATNPPPKLSMEKNTPRRRPAIEGECMKPSERAVEALYKAIPSLAYQSCIPQKGVAAIIARETGCDEAAELIAGCEWVRWDDPHDGAGGEQCPTCGQEKTDGHATDCKRAKYLAAVNG